MEYLFLLILVIVVIVLIRLGSGQKKTIGQHYKPKQVTRNEKLSEYDESYSGKYIYRKGEMVKADSVFEAWTSGNLKTMLDALDKPTNGIDRHFLLSGIVNETYRNRSDSRMANICAKVSEKHIAEFPALKNELMEDMPDDLKNWTSWIPTFQKYATLLTEQGKYQKAIEVCRKAIEFGLDDGTKSGFEGRIKRIKKMGNRF